MESIQKSNKFRKRPEWTGEIAKRMHIYGITVPELAQEADRNPKYISTVLNSERSSPKIEKLLFDAVDRLIEKRESIIGTLNIDGAAGGGDG